MKQVRSKYLKRKFGKFTVVSAVNLNEGNHKLFYLTKCDGSKSVVVTLRDNDMTALDTGRKTIEQLISELAF